MKQYKLKNTPKGVLTLTQSDSGLFKFELKFTQGVLYFNGKTIDELKAQAFLCIRQIAGNSQIPDSCLQDLIDVYMDIDFFLNDFQEELTFPNIPGFGNFSEILKQVHAKSSTLDLGNTIQIPGGSMRVVKLSDLFGQDQDDLNPNFFSATSKKFS